jgi:alkanesulfonate monooxygenase SsuD/methylene tetrahydromethanopterin reductase-like flavin-dependent oxidoreductase (luciferase family)
METTRGFGLAGESPLETISIAAAAAEKAGYETFWLSQPREGSTLTKLDVVARSTRGIRLGVGAIPLTDLTPEEINRQIRERSLPLDRLRLGIGSGTGTGSLDRLRRGVDRLRSLANVEIVVAPLGPKMCRLAGELGDTVLLNWLTPTYAATSITGIREAASSAGRDIPVIAGYVRCAVGTSSRSRLEMECDRYGSFPHYAAHFERQGVRPIETTIHVEDSEQLQRRLHEYESVLDHVIVRAITPADEPSDVLALVDGAKPRD